MPNQIPVEVVFNPNWWFQNYGISFQPPFYFDRELRIRNDVAMRRALYERLGLGEPNPSPRPIIGSMHVAGGFVTPALFGVEIRFADNQAPWNVPLQMSPDEIRALKPPDIQTTWPMNEIMAQMDALQKEFGYVVGDLNTGGIINTALEIRGQQLFTDFFDDPALVHHLFSVIAETQVRLAGYLKSRTGTNSVAVNRSIVNVDPAIYVHGNCSVQMISPRTYAEFLLPYELYLAQRLPPYGIHHCGDNLHQFCEQYSKLPLKFLDVGWGSDVARCRESFPDAFLNLRLSPVRMLTEPAEQIRKDTQQLLSAGFKTGKVGVCCINMDYGTPDENVLAMIETAREFG